MIKQLKFELKSENKHTNSRTKKENVNNIKVNLTNESKMFDMDCSRRLAKKVIARNKLDL